MQSPWQQKPTEFWNITATKWHLLLPGRLRLLGSPLGHRTPERLVSAWVRVWHKWTVNRHEISDSCEIKINYTVVDAALKRSLGYLNSHRSDKKEEGKLQKSTERRRDKMLLSFYLQKLSVQNNFWNEENSKFCFFFKGKTTQGLETKPFI